MTETNSTTTPRAADAAPPTPGPDDPRSHLAHAVAAAGTAIAGTGPDQMALCTPCSEFDVVTLGRHMVAILRRVAVVGRGEHWTTVPDMAEEVAGDELAAEWQAAAHLVQEAWSDPELLDRPVELPFGTVPGAAAMAVYTAEFSIHAWDLASATGQSPTWDEPSLEVALQAVTFGVPAEGRGPEMPFDPVVPTRDDAPPIDRLVAWMGRRP